MKDIERVGDGTAAGIVVLRGDEPNELPDFRADVQAAIGSAREDPSCRLDMLKRRRNPRRPGSPFAFVGYDRTTDAWRRRQNASSLSATPLRYLTRMDRLIDGSIDELELSSVDVCMFVVG